MDVQYPVFRRTSQTSPGDLFVLISSKGNAICIRGDFAGASEDEDRRVVPIHWPTNESDVGVAIYQSALNGDVVVLDGARLEVDALSVCDGSDGTVLDVFQSDEGLFFPLVNRGRIVNFINASSGVIIGTGGKWLAYSEWRVTLPSDASNRTHLFGSTGIITDE